MEADITPALAADLVGEQTSQRVELPIVAVDADGWDNTAFGLGDEPSVRLPSAECYVALGGLGLGSRPRCRWPAEPRPGLRPRSDLRPKRRAVDGRQLAFVAYWHSGFVALDVTDPGDPVLDGHTVYGADEDGDGHSSMYDDARQLLFAADKDFGKNCGPGIEPGYGYLRIWDYSNLAAPVQIGESRTPSSGGRSRSAPVTTRSTNRC